MAKQYIGTGRRKSAIARVRLIPGTGKVTVNKKDLDDYFPMENLKNSEASVLHLRKRRQV